MNDHDLEQQLQQPVPPPDADTKARHIAAAMAAFTAQQTSATADENLAIDVEKDSPLATESNPAVDKHIISPKKSNVLQGFLQRLRPTRDINHHGSDSMNNSTFDNNPGVGTRPVWQKPALISGIAASSLAVLAGITFMQHLAINPVNDELTASLAKQAAAVNEQRQKSEQAKDDFAEKKLAAKAAEEAVAADIRTEAPAEINVISAEDIGSLPDRNVADALQRIPGVELEAAAPPPAPSANYTVPIAPALAKPTVRQADAAEEVQVAGIRQVLANAPAMKRAVGVADMPSAPPQEYRDRFEDFKENAVTSVSETPVSTFSIDVDTASYSFVRRQLNNGQLPAKDAVRIEEMINYFDYAYPAPRDKKTPFATHVSVMDSPWKKGNQLVHIGIQGYQLPASDIPQSNLVFLLDVSGSMDEPTKLPLVKQSMGLLLDTLKPDDTIAIAVYAGAAGTVLEPTQVKEKAKILAALNNLQAGGSTAGAEGIALAYKLAEANFNSKGINRIILATDGDFNVGQTSDDALQDLIERKRDKGIYLSVLGFGQGNYQDAMMQTLAQNGNGTAAYIDTLSEAQKVLVNEATSTLFPIAKDVKIQVEFNPATVAEYRLIGYETRALNREDFNNDKVDAGEIGSGHKVTAIYEITPANAENKLLEPSRYQSQAAANGKSNELAFLRVRYKLPHENQSKLIETAITKNTKENNSTYQQEANFSIAVAGFAQLLRGSHYSGDFNYDKVIELAQANKGKDEFGYRTEFIQLVRKAKIAKE